MQRHAFLTASAGALVLSTFARASAAGDPALAEIERRSGGRLGVYAFDTATGGAIGYRDNERFPMCSTFKLLAVGAVLARVDAGNEDLHRRVAIVDADILSYAPITKRIYRTAR